MKNISPFSDEIIDLKGFRLYLNNELIRDENQLGPDLRTLTIDQLEPGKYNLEMEAVSTFGIVSRRSQKRVVTIRE